MDLFDDPATPADGGSRASGPGRPPPPARAPYADDWPGRSGQPQRRRVLLVAAALPWVVVAALLLGGGPTTDAPTPRPTAPVPTPTPSDGDGPPRMAPVPDASEPAATPPLGEVATASTAAGTSVTGRAAAVAVRVVRAWLSSHHAGEPPAGLGHAPGADTRYVEHVVVEGIDLPAPGALVVTVTALVLPVEQNRYGTFEVHRLAVPLRLDGAAVVLAGAPWPLPVEDLALGELTTNPVDDPDLQLAAAEALQDAGFRDVTVERLARSDGWPWVVNATARGPGEDQPRAHVVWLRADIGRLVVAGTTAADADPTPSPTDPGAAE